MGRQDQRGRETPGAVIYLELGKGQRCWFDLLAGRSIEVGDIVTGNLWSYGGQELFNSTRGCKVKVFMEGHR